MTNIALESIDKYLDVSSKNSYYSFLTWLPEEKRLRRIHISSRDSARTPVQWSAEKNAGFSEAEPWFYVNPNYTEINAEAEEKDEGSILNFYRACLALRSSEETLLKGSYREYFRLSGRLYMYERRLGETKILVICSFSEKNSSYRLPKSYSWSGAKLLLDNYSGGAEKGSLRPYEAQIYKWQ